MFQYIFSTCCRNNPKNQGDFPQVPFINQYYSKNQAQTYNISQRLQILPNKKEHYFDITSVVSEKFQQPKEQIRILPQKIHSNKSLTTLYGDSVDQMEFFQENSQEKIKIDSIYYKIVKHQKQNSKNNFYFELGLLQSIQEKQFLQQYKVDSLNTSATSDSRHRRRKRDINWPSTLRSYSNTKDL